MFGRIFGWTWARCRGGAATWLLVAGLAPGLAQAQGATPAAAPPPPPDGLNTTPSLFWKSGDHRFDLGASVRVRGEGWSAFANDMDWFGGARTRVRAQYSFKQLFFAAAEFQDVQLFSMNEDGTGALALYRNASGDGEHAGGDDLRGLYVEGRPTSTSFLRVGRQDIKLGHEVLYPEPNWKYLKTARLGERLVGTVGWSHVERAYDGAAGAAEYAGVQLYGFAARPTTGVFDAKDAYSDQSNIHVGGAVVTAKRGTLLKDTELAFFGIGYGDQRPQTDGGLDKGLELGTLGFHWLGVYPVGPGNADVTLWGAFQFGDYNDLDHRAGAGIVEVGYQLPNVWAKPWLRGGINVASGDTDAGDGDHGTFFNILPTNHLYYGYADQLAFQNLTNPFVQLRASPLDTLSLNFFVHWFHLTEEDDARYAGTGAFDKTVFGFPATPTGGRTRIGTEYDLVATWTPHRTTTLELGYAHLDGGAMFRSARDRDLDFFYASLELKY
jgi:hypothetical protein